MKSTPNLKWLDSLGRRDFENGATLEEIRRVFKQCADLQSELARVSDLLRYVAHLRLPLGDTVIEHLDFERQKQIHELLK